MKEEHSWLKNNGIVYTILARNAYNTKMPHIKSTGFRTASLCYSERDRLNNIAEEFLVNSYLKRNDPEVETSITSYLSDDGMKMVSLTGLEDSSNYHTVKLTNGAPLDIALGEAIVRRRSSRDFTGDPVQLESLATILRATAGIAAKAEAKLKDGELVQFNLRPVPSGGGLQPIDLYVVALNIKKFSRGLYRYDPIEDQLIMIENTEEKLNELLKSFSGPVDIVKSSNASSIVLFVAKPWRSMRKYGNRGLRFVFHEAGGMAQNMHLAATGLGLGSLDCASFYEDDAHKALSFDGVYQSLIHSILIGVTA